MKEENVILVNFLASPEGLDAVSQAHPKLEIITSSIEEKLNNAFMVPGIGDFGDRYFGTVDPGAR